MPSWNSLFTEFSRINSVPPDPKKTNDLKVKWINTHLKKYLELISHYKNDKNVIFYASAFLQKPNVPAFNTQITYEDMNGLMSMLHGMDCTKGLVLLLHTPGGVTSAAESIVDYLHSKFTDIEVIIPTISMSAGTMIALSANRINMGRQSQLGPIDPQLPYNGAFLSANAIVKQFDRAKAEIMIDEKNALVWAPILGNLGASLIQDAQDALDYSERMVANWLSKRMFSDKENPKEEGDKVAKYFNSTGSEQHKSHARRIGREDARSQGLSVDYLEDNSCVQDAVLSLYHILTIIFETSPSTKIMVKQDGTTWAKNFLVPGIPNQ